jgi:hypothetical protein
MQHCARCQQAQALRGGHAVLFSNRRWATGGFQ